MGRPIGVTIITVLMVIAGILMVIAGISAMALAPFISMAAQSQDLAGGISTTMLGGFAAATGAFMLVLGIASLAIRTDSSREDGRGRRQSFYQ